MATANFHARLERISQAQQPTGRKRRVPIREIGGHIPGATPAGMIRRRRHPVIEHFRSLGAGIMLGLVAAVALIGLNREAFPWGPGTSLNGLIWWPATGSLVLAALLLLSAVFLASKRPGFALFTLGYLSGLTLAVIA